MKTTFIYGIGIAVVSFVSGLILFLLGFHNDPEKLSTGQLIGSITGFVIMVAGLIMVMKARREEFTSEEGFGYGRALGTGTLTALWSAIAGGILTIIYAALINPGMQEVIMESEIAKLEEQGVPSDAIDQAEGIMNFMTSPVMMGVTNIIMGFIIGFILSLIVAAFLKRAPVDVAPPPPPAAA